MFSKHCQGKLTVLNIFPYHRSPNFIESAFIFLWWRCRHLIVMTMPMMIMTMNMLRMGRAQLSIKADVVCGDSKARPREIKRDASEWICIKCVNIANWPRLIYFLLRNVNSCFQIGFTLRSMSGTTQIFVDLDERLKMENIVISVDVWWVSLSQALGANVFGEEFIVFPKFQERQKMCRWDANEV